MLTLESELQNEFHNERPMAQCSGPKILTTVDNTAGGCADTNKTPTTQPLRLEQFSEISRSSPTPWTTVTNSDPQYVSKHGLGPDDKPSLKKDIAIIFGIHGPNQCHRTIFCTAGRNVRSPACTCGHYPHEGSKMIHSPRIHVVPFATPLERWCSPLAAIGCQHTQMASSQPTTSVHETSEGAAGRALANATSAAGQRCGAGFAHRSVHDVAEGSRTAGHDVAQASRSVAATALPRHLVPPTPPPTTA